MADPATLNREFLTREQVAEFLCEHGIPIGKSTVRKLCSPSIGEGPTVAAWWGKRALHRPYDVLAWARSRLADRPGRLRAYQREATAA